MNFLALKMFYLTLQADFPRRENPGSKSRLPGPWIKATWRAAQSPLVSSLGGPIPEKRVSSFCFYSFNAIGHRINIDCGYVKSKQLGDTQKRMYWKPVKEKKFLNWQHPVLTEDPTSQHFRVYNGRIYPLDNEKQLNSKGFHTQNTYISCHWLRTCMQGRDLGCKSSLGVNSPLQFTKAAGCCGLEQQRVFLLFQRTGQIGN